MNDTQYPYHLLVLVILISTSLPFVHGEAEHLWSPTNGPPGGGFGIIKINPENPDLMYIGSGYTFYRSTNGGESWIRAEDLHIMSCTEELGVQAIVFDPQNPSRVYVGTRGGLFRSNDDGENWIRLTDESVAHTVNEIAVDPENSDLIFIVTTFAGPESHFFRSTDAGMTWTSLTSYLPGQLHLSNLVSLGGDELYMGIGSGEGGESCLFYSGDGGKTWHQPNLEQGMETHLAMIRVNPHNRNHIYLGYADNYNRGRSLEELLVESKDGGDTWSKVHGGEIGSVVSDLVFSASNPDLIYYQSPLHRSMDGGKTWHRVKTWNNVQDFGNVEQTTLVIHPENPDILFSALMGQGIAKSIDGGKTWWLSTEGICASFVTNLAASPQEPDTLYTAGGDGSGTWKSTDGGETWSILNKNGITHPWVDELTIVPTEPDTVYDIADVGLIYRTRDGGESWREINNGFHFSSVYALAVDPNNPQTVYASDNGFGVFKTTDSGDWWGYQLGSPDYTYSMVIDPENSDIIYSGHNKKLFENSTYIYQSVDGGESWNQIHEIADSEAVTSISIDKQTPQRVYAGVTGKEGLILNSEDRGETWSQLTENFTFSTIHAQDQIAVDPTNPEKIYASPWGAGLYVSTDMGSSWNELKTPSVSISSIALDSTGTIYIADRTQARVYQSVDGGQSWSVFFDAGMGYSRLSKVKVDPVNPDIIWVAAFKHNAVLGSLFRVEDGVPEDCTGSLPRSVIDIEIDPSNHNTVYVSLHGENIYKTLDGGETWSKLEMAVTGVFDIQILPDSPETLYAATMAGRACPPELLYQDIFEAVDPETIGDKGVYKSQDGGLTWNRVSQDFIDDNCMALTVHPENHDVIYVATSAGVYLSTDSGATWSIQNRGLGFTDVGALSITSEYLIAGTRGGGVYVGEVDDSYEVSWTPSTGPVPRISHIQIEVDPMDSDILYASSYPGGMYKSTDRGVTWRDKNFFLPSFQVDDPVREGYYKFVIDPEDSERLYFAVYGKGVYASDDGADSQFPLFGERGELRGAESTNIVVSPVNTDQIFVSTTDGVYRSNDRGESWVPVNDGFYVPDIMSLAFDRNGVLYAGSKGYGVYKLGKNHDTWIPCEPVQNFGVFWEVWERPLYLYNALLINPFYPDIMYLGTFPTGFYRTLDGGASWHEINTNFTIDGAFAMTFHPYDKRVIFAGTYNGISMSTDAGETWSKINNGMPPELWVFSIVFDPSDPETVYASAKNGENKGSGRDGFRGTVLKSVDGGEIWFQITDGLDVNQEYYQLIMYPHDYDVLFVSSSNGVYMTRDGGERWEPIFDGLEVSDEHVVQSGVVNNVANNLVLSSDAQYMYLGTQGRGVYKADLSWLELTHDPETLPLSCFNGVMDGNETGIDTGGPCIPRDGEYNYGFIIDEKNTNETGIESETNNTTKPHTTETPSENETLPEPTPDKPKQGIRQLIPGFNLAQIVLGLLILITYWLKTTHH